MNRARVAFALLGLGAGLLFYFAYRSEHTLSNRLVRCICGDETYRQLSNQVRAWMPVPADLRGSLPSALWCMIATSLIGSWSLSLRGRVLSLATLCPWINAAWELVQWSGATDGRGDWRDVVAGALGWGFTRLVFSRASPPVELPLRWSWRLGVVAAGFACMGFADVWK